MKLTINTSGRESVVRIEEDRGLIYSRTIKTAFVKNLRVSDLINYVKEKK